MTKRRMMLVFLLCFSIGGLTRMTHFQACSLASDAGHSAEMSEAQRKREAERRFRQHELERRKKDAERKRQRAQKMRELEEQGRGVVNREQSRKAAAERRREFFHEEHALAATPEQWELIKAKLEKVRRLRRQPGSYVGAALAGGPGDSGERATTTGFQWDIRWKNTPRDEITEAQKLAQQIASLLGRASTTPEALRLKIAALRKARRQEADIEKQRAEARRELRELLTTRQEAVLVLLQWL